MNLDKTVYVADSKIEAESWIKTIGKSKYPGARFTIKSYSTKFLVLKKV